MTTRVALIACSNGYGHIRRLLFLLEALRSRSAEPVLFAPLKSVQRLVQTEGVAPPEQVDFDSQTTISSWLDGTAWSWYKRLPSLSEYDVVVCDNLIEILKVRPDAWLSGSFFWHESLEEISRELKRKSQELLITHRPRMISSSLFSSEKLMRYTRLYEVGLYKSGTEKTPNLRNKHDILIACGRGGRIEDEAKQFVTSLAKVKPTVFKKVWVDPAILPTSTPYWMMPATFTSQMYNSILAVVIRPGVGTVTNSLIAGAKVFSFYETGSCEMQENAQKITDAGYGCNTSSIEEAWKSAVTYAENSYAQKRHFHLLKGLNMDGAEETAKILLERGDDQNSIGEESV